MESILLLSRLFLAAILATAGIAKVLDLKGSETAVRDFGIPEPLVKPFSFILPISEILIALLFFPLSTSWIGAFGALLLLVGFNLGMGYQMAKGNAPDCHCFGQLHTEPVSAKSLIRNGIFAIPALFLVLRGSGGQGPNLVDVRIYTPELVFGLILTAGVAGSLLLLKSILKKQSAILRRLEILEVISSDGASVERSNAGDPNDGLPIGAVFPDFELPDVRGRVVSFDDILGQGKAMLFFFVAPTCQPCGALIPEIEKWQVELSDKINFVFISRGTPDENIAKFPSGTEKTFLLQRDREFQEQIYAKWTPSALLVNADGRIASHIASGDSAIRSMIEKLRTENLDDPFFYFAIDREGQRTPKIGELVPDFELNDIEGRTVRANELQGKPTLVTFWSLTCPHCRDMAEQIKEWEKNRGVDDPNLLLFSDGDAEDHRDVGISSPILIDDEHKTALKFGMQGTPSGVLIDENGRIVSETAIGAASIWALIGRKR